MFRRILPVAVLVAAGCGKAPPPDVVAPAAGEFAKLAKAEVNAEGATFVEPIMKVWTN